MNILLLISYAKTIKITLSYRFSNKKIVYKGITSKPSKTG